MKKIISWIEIGCRYFICIFMLLYGLVKLFRLQFSVESYLQDTPLHQLNGTQLTWAFYDFHPAYQIIIGIVEVVIGLLVLFSRTSKLGIVLFLPVSFNIMLLNFLFGIQALATSVTLFVAGCILLAIYFKSYVKYFFVTSIMVSAKNKFKTIIGSALAIVTGCVMAVFVIYHNDFTIKNDKKLIAKWNVINTSNIRSFYFEKGDLLVVKTQNDTFLYGRYKCNNNTLLIKSKDSTVNMGHFSYRFANDSLLVLNGNKESYLLKRYRFKK